MKSVKIKEVMIPVEEYSRVKKDTTLFEALQCLVKQGEEQDLSHPHRDLLVEDESGKVVGKITMLDIFKHMEPTYFKMDKQLHPGALSRDFVQKVYRDFNLWSEPLSDLCRKNAGVKAEDIMHSPKKAEFVQENDSLDRAIHAFILGVHQPLLVQSEGAITGVLRLGDAFERVRNSILECDI